MQHGLWRHRGPTLTFWCPGPWNVFPWPTQANFDHTLTHGWLEHPMIPSGARGDCPRGELLLDISQPHFMVISPPTDYTQSSSAWCLSPNLFGSVLSFMTKVVDSGCHDDLPLAARPWLYPCRPLSPYWPVRGRVANHIGRSHHAAAS